MIQNLEELPMSTEPMTLQNEGLTNRSEESSYKNEPLKINDPNSLRLGKREFRENKFQKQKPERNKDIMARGPAPKDIQVQKELYIE